MNQEMIETLSHADLQQTLEEAALLANTGAEGALNTTSSAFSHGFRAGRVEGLISLISAVEQALGQTMVAETAEQEMMHSLAGDTREPIVEAVIPTRTQPCVLVVDDEPINVDLLADTFGEDFEVLTAADGKSALELAGEKMPDLILLDVMMPGMSGYDVCRQLKSESKTRDLPVMFITCLGDVVAETMGLELGAVDYITKPIHPWAVLARVNNQVKLKLATDKLVRLAALEQSLRTNLLEALEAKSDSFS
ncbi:Response regulator receiver domain-containing protein [Granulicella rosea]|uniref:Response regulator receiver domain-containing protein n=1 Tax=Granulicella rosea TaxID=474952 RepID=A0A239JSX0_9BACT|nr:response regulator [Granulicella rosea]SNT08875.1 Response regulator receiver domain-containing protein [Granulicella rosea]